MDTNESKIEDQVLPEDLEEANTLAIWKNYCIAQIFRCLDMWDYKGVRYFNSELLRTVNDLEFLQFKKIDHERKTENEKGN